jgi:hypothetical protein
LDPSESVIFSAKETKNAANYYVEKAAVTIIDASEGKVSLTLTSDDLPFAGVWWAAFQVVTSGGTVRQEIPAWLLVHKGIDHDIRENTPLCPSELRLFMLDRCPEDNFLLDDVEFSDEEYMAAIRWVVDKWNEQPPNVGVFTPATFPWRYNWMTGAAAMLLKMAARSQARNHLTFSTGTTTVDDTNKQNPYMALAKELNNEFLVWMDAKKTEINMNLCYGTLTSWEFRGSL